MKRTFLFTSFVLVLLQGSLLSQNSNYNSAGTATASGNGCFTLTNSTSQAGAVWNIHTIDLTQPIDITLILNFGNQDANGADGMSFILQSSGTGVSSDGSGVGFAGIIPSFGVVMDTYQNGDDPSNDHISIHQNGNVTHDDPDELVSYLNSSNFPANVEDGNAHVFRFVWTPSVGGGTVNVYFDNQLTISYTGDLVNSIFNGNPTVYWGMSASTGNKFNVQTMCISIDANFSFIGACTNQPISFIDESNSGTPISSWSWDFGDGTPIVSGPNPSHVYTIPGTYHVILTITNSAGQTSIKSRDITVHEPQIQIQALQPVCTGAQVTLNASISIVPNTVTQQLVFSNTLDFPIPDGGIANDWNGTIGTFASSPIVASGLQQGWNIQSVGININHVYDGDLSIYLKDPCGNLLLLAEDIGSSDDNFSNCYFSPSATEPISNGSAPFSGTWIPQNSASSWSPILACSNPNGTWQLLVGDVYTGDAGFINDWSITFTVPISYTYLWTPINNSTSLTPSFISDQSGWYVLNAIDNMGCRDKDSVYLTVGTALPISISGDLEICNGESTTLTVSGADTYEWNDHSTNAAITVNPTITTTYSVIGTSSSCTSGATATVIVNQNPVISVNSETICEGESASLIPTGADQYSWISDPLAGVPFVVSPVTSTSYVVVGTNGYGCTGSATSTVTVNPNPVLTVSSPSVCEGENAVFTATGAETYVWSENNFIGNPLIISPAVSGEYIVTVTGNLLNCSSQLEAHLQVNPLPIADFSLSAVEGCSPLTIIANDASQGTISQWDWEVNDISSYTTQSPEMIFSQPGQHTIQLNVTTDQGCKSSSSTKVINVYTVTAGIADRGNRFIIGETVDLLYVGMGASQWNWDLGNGQTSTQVNASTIYQQEGEYLITQTVSNDFGCSDVAQITIIVNPLFTVYIPNAFTPNDDGINDVWQFSGESWMIDNFEVSVFDRWGKMVFCTTDVNVNWDGTVNGKLAESQTVYQYRLRILDREGINHEIWGSIVVIH